MIGSVLLILIVVCFLVAVYHGCVALFLYLNKDVAQFMDMREEERFEKQYQKDKAEKEQLKKQYGNL